MSLTTRTAKGSPLTWAEVDANWAHCSPTAGTTQDNLDLKGNLGTPNTWTKANRGAFVTLTSTSNSVAIDLSLANNFAHELVENTTLAAPTNVVAGQVGVLEFEQDGTGGRTLGFNAFWVFQGTPVLNTTAAAREVIRYVVNADGLSANCVLDDVVDLTNYARLDTAQTFTKAQRGQFVTLTSSGASIAVDLSLSNNYVHALTENTTLAAPSNVVAGQAGMIEFNQHASAPKTLAFNAFWKFPGGTVPTLTATNSAMDILSYTVNAAGTSATCVMLGDVK